jgi:ATP:corrinoid adenosyltransferase
VCSEEDLPRFPAVTDRNYHCHHHRLHHANQSNSTDTNKTKQNKTKQNKNTLHLSRDSFGKGKIQAVFGLESGEGMTMTVAQYVTPKGTVIQGRGLAPDVRTASGGNAFFNMMKAFLVDAGDDLSDIDFAAVSRVRSICSSVL